MSDRLYVLQVVVAVEDQWFAPDTDGPPIRVEKRYHIEASLFAADNAEAAYRTGVDWLTGYSDSNHDGPGDLTVISAVGIHELEEAIPRVSDLPAAVCGLYGLHVGYFDPSDLPAGGVPRVRLKNDLAVFRRPVPGGH